MDLKLLGQLQQLGEVEESEIDHHAYPPMCCMTHNVLLNMKGREGVTCTFTCRWHDVTHVHSAYHTSCISSMKEGERQPPTHFLIRGGGRALQNLVVNRSNEEY